jgi:phthalate 4,5-dioxygenase oxygenase subunit
MLSKEDNALLTQVGPGTPMGELFRRFWLPTLLSDELPGADCVPVRLRLLGEDLIAFRDTQGRVGVLDAYCPHRNAPLFFGRNEESGLRCVYHGWKFDVNGTCVDLPNAIEGESFKSRVHILHYPTFESAGMVWLYMGPKDKQPPYPGFDWVGLPETHTYVRKYWIACNYMQTLENEFDPGHSAFLHSSLNTASGTSDAGRSMTGLTLQQRRQQQYEVIETDYGAAMAAVRPGIAGDGARILSLHYMMPCFSTAGAVSAPGTHPINIKVPVDDEHTAFFRLKWSPEPLSKEVLDTYRAANHEYPEQIPGTFLTKSNKSNDYLVDRNKQRFYNFTGMDPYPVQDFAMVENQRGPVAARWRETAVSSDKYILQVRKRLLSAARALQAGVEPAEPWRPEAYKGIRNFKVVPPEEQASLHVLGPSPVAAVVGS